MSLALSPAQTVQLAQSAYAMRLDTDMLTAAQAAGTGGDQFDIASGSRFTGVSGLSIPGGSSRTGFGYVAHGKAGSKRQGETVICVRGTEPTSVHDLMTDAHMSAARSPLGLPVHEGFKNVASSILGQVQAALRGKIPAHFTLSVTALVGRLQQSLQNPCAVQPVSSSIPMALQERVLEATLRW